MGIVRLHWSLGGGGVRPIYIVDNREPILTGRTLACGIYIRTDSIIDIMMKHTTNEGAKPHESNDVSGTKTRKYDLTDMLSRMNQSNCHSEHKTGAAQGKEEW